MKEEMTIGCDAESPTDTAPPKTRRSEPKPARNATGVEKLPKLLNILLWNPKLHYQGDLARRLLGPKQTVHHYGLP